MNELTIYQITSKIMSDVMSKLFLVNCMCEDDDIMMVIDIRNIIAEKVCDLHIFKTVIDPKKRIIVGDIIEWVNKYEEELFNIRIVKNVNGKIVKSYKIPSKNNICLKPCSSYCENYKYPHIINIIQWIMIFEQKYKYPLDPQIEQVS